MYLPLVLQPTETSCMKLLDFIVSRVQCGDDNCVSIRDRIWDNVTFESFKTGISNGILDVICYNY